MKEMITAEMTEIRNLIIQTAAKRSSLKKEMEQWYTQHLTKRFPKMNELITVDASLSELDSHYKRLWDYYNSKPHAS